MNAVLRETTASADTLLKSVMMSSVMPSLKYSCSGSPLMLAKGSTQIDGAAAARSRLARSRRVRRRSRASAKHVDGARDVLDRVLAQIARIRAHLALDLIAHHARERDAARRRQRLQPRGHVDAVAVDIVALDDDFAEIDADAIADALGSGGHCAASLASWISCAQLTAATRRSRTPPARRRPSA